MYLFSESIFFKYKIVVLCNYSTLYKSHMSPPSATKLHFEVPILLQHLSSL